jgi:hypothetical protein
MVTNSYSWYLSRTYARLCSVVQYEESYALLIKVQNKSEKLALEKPMSKKITNFFQMSNKALIKISQHEMFLCFVSSCWEKMEESGRKLSSPNTYSVPYTHTFSCCEKVLESVYKVGLFLGAIACWRWGGE